MKITSILKSILIPNQKLSQRAISSGIWLGISRVASRILTLIKMVILARILAPQDFGLFGIALIVLSFLQNFSQPGTSEALIQNQKGKRIYLDVAWTIKVLRGIILALLLFILAPIIARFFNEPKATYLMYIIGTGLIFGGFGNQGIIYFIKDLEFHKQFIYEFSCTIADFIVSLILVFILRDAFALAYGYLAGILVLSIASYIVHPFRPRFTINIPVAKELARFGRWIWGSTVIVFVLTQGVGFFVGKVLGTVFLGFYQMAIKISDALTVEVGSIFSNVGFSLYSRLQDNKAKLNEAYSKSLKINAFLVIPIAIFLIIFTNEITNVLLGVKWTGIVPIIKIFALYGLARSFSFVNIAILKAIGSPSIITRMQIAKLLLLSVGIFYFCHYWKLEGVTFLMMIIELSMLPLEFFIVTKKIGFSRMQLIKIIIIPFITSVISLLIVNFLISGLGLVRINAMSLVIVVVINIVIYGAILYLLDLKIHFGLRRILNKNYILALLGNKK